jgi:hypothetical protein
VKEQSHKHEMDAAVRGDFARLRARGVATTIAVDGEPPSEPEVVPDPADTVADDGSAGVVPGVRPARRRFFRRD